MRKRITIARKLRQRSARQIVKKLVRELPNLFKLVFRLLKDPRVAGMDKLLFGAVAVYMLAPIDLIPDFLGPLGWTDDLYLLGLALTRLIGSGGPDTLLENWDGDPAALGYLVEGVEQIGGGLPKDVKHGLRGVADEPGRLGRLGRKDPKRGARRVRRIRVDDEDRIRVEEDD